MTTIEHVTVDGPPLTGAQFRHITEHILGQPERKQPEGSCSFGPMGARSGEAVCAYLRQQLINHTRESITRWAMPVHPGPRT